MAAGTIDVARICSQSIPSRGKTERMGGKGLMFLVTVTQSLKQGRGDKSKSEAKFAGGWLMADIPMLTQGLSVTVGVFFLFLFFTSFYTATLRPSHDATSFSSGSGMTLVSAFVAALVLQVKYSIQQILYLVVFDGCILALPHCSAKVRAASALLPSHSQAEA